MLAEQSAVANAASDTKHYDAIVLGAGISGLVSASVLLKQGYSRILIADAYGHLGGNHIDWSSGGYTFDVGSFIFQDDSPLLKHFPELLPLYVPIAPTWGRLNPQGLITAYPISPKDDILNAGFVGLVRIFSSVIYARLFQRHMKNAKDFARYWIGGHLLYRSGLESYMKRFYGVPPEEIDLQLAQKRMLWISEHASIANLLRRVRRPRQNGPTNTQLARPKTGFEYLYRVVEEQLRGRGVTFHLNAKVRKLQKADQAFFVEIDGCEYSAGRLISTIPINHVEAMCGIEAKPLKTITLLSLFFSFSGTRGFPQPIIYNFSHDGAWKRITVYSDFYGKANNREYFTAEVISDHVGHSVERAEQDFRDHVRANGLFNGDLTLEGSMFLENAYPIYSERSSERAAEAVKLLEQLGIESFGRQGGFNYQPTARVSTIEAEAALAHAPST